MLHEIVVPDRSLLAAVELYSASSSASVFPTLWGKSAGERIECHRVHMVPLDSVELRRAVEGAKEQLQVVHRSDFVQLVAAGPP